MFLSDDNFERLYTEYGAKTEIEKASAFSEGVCAIVDGLFRGDSVRFFGDHSPDIEFRAGEVTILAGASGHGKSAFVGQVALDLASQGEKVCVMSFEMKPERTLYRMCRQAVRTELTAESATDFLASLGDSVYLLNKVGGVTPELVFGATIKATQLGCTHIIIDNLMKCVPEYGNDANEHQKKFIETLCDLAKACNCHIWLVCHVRKGQNETDKADKYSIRGAAAITDQADNVLIFIRNLSKERKVEENGLTPELDQDEADNTLVVDKQRNGDWQGQIPLWFDKPTYCFCKSPERNIPIFNF